jgi:pimeloyl-ACP methyl ester carboxylesterase
MDTILSRDGTPIAYHRRGNGQPLVLVHGSGAANPMAWVGVIPTLEEHFTLYTPDRRGRGDSGDGATYGLEREVEDIAALIDSIGAPVHLLGHSFGALCALEAALIAPAIHKLILYEPGLTFPDQPLYPAGVVDRLQSLLDAGDREGALVLLYREVVMMTPEDIDALRASLAWVARVGSAHTMIREAHVEEAYRFEGARFAAMHIPTLLVSGEDSPPILKRATDTIAAALPDSRIAVLPGQQHLAMYSAPDLLSKTILYFLMES